MYVNGGTECLNTRFPLPTLLYAGYSVKKNVNKNLTYTPTSNNNSKPFRTDI